MKTLLKFMFICSLCLFTNISFAQEDPVYIVVQESPRFPGCEIDKYSLEEKNECSTSKMLEFIYNNLKYPELARSSGVEGQIVLQFIIEKDGSVSNINVVRPLEGGCTEAAVEVVEAMNKMDSKWTPGKQSGKVVRVKYTLPIKFKLEDNKNNRKKKN